VSKHKSCQKQTNLIAFHAHHFVYGADPHAIPQPGNIQQGIKGDGELSIPMAEELPQAALTMGRQTGLPSLLEANIALSLI